MLNAIEKFQKGKISKKHKIKKKLTKKLKPIKMKTSNTIMKIIMSRRRPY